MIDTEKTVDQAFKIQSRPEWYQMNFFLQEVGRGVAELRIPPQVLVYIGGAAHFHRCYEVFGNIAVSHFRGLHDVDALCFANGVARRVLDLLVAKPDSIVTNYYLGHSTSLQDKESFVVALAKGNDPALASSLELDVFESKNGYGIKFNNRNLRADKIIFDAPEVLNLPNCRGSVSVPTLRDSFVSKMDVTDFSLSGLRPKDVHDILITLRIAYEMGLNMKDFIYSLVEDCVRQEAIAAAMKEFSPSQRLSRIGNLYSSLQSKLTSLENILGYCPSIHHYSKTCPLFPRHEHLGDTLHLLRKIRRETCPGAYTCSFS